MTLVTVLRAPYPRTSQTRPPARQALQPTGRPANARRSGKRSWRRSSRAWRRCGFTRTWSETTATAPRATTACGGSSPGCGRKRRCRFGGWRPDPAEEAQVDFGTGAAVRMADGKVRRPWIFRIVLELQPQGVQRGRVAADFGSVHRHAWRTPSVISAACPSGWSLTT